MDIQPGNSQKKKFRDIYYKILYLVCVKKKRGFAKQLHCTTIFFHLLCVPW